MNVGFWLQYLKRPLIKSISILPVWYPFPLMHPWWHRCLFMPPPALFLAAGQMDSSWPQYPEATALLSDVLLPVHNFSAEQCELWRSHGFYSYAWIN